MAEGTIYNLESDARKYAEEVGGIVVEVDQDGDGEADGWQVIGISEGSRGFNPDEVDDAATRKQQEDYLRRLEAAGGPKGKNMGGVVVDELGYRQGGMNFNERGSVKYSKGGAVKGKNFAGTF